MLNALRRLIQRYGFFKRAEPRSYFDHIPAPTDAQIVRWGEGARNVANVTRNTWRGLHKGCSTWHPAQSKAAVSLKSPVNVTH